MRTYRKFRTSSSRRLSRGDCGRNAQIDGCCVDQLSSPDKPAVRMQPRNFDFEPVATSPVITRSPLPNSTILHKTEPNSTIALPYPCNGKIIATSFFSILVCTATNAFAFHKIEEAFGNRHTLWFWQSKRCKCSRLAGTLDLVSGGARSYGTRECQPAN